MTGCKFVTFLYRHLLYLGCQKHPPPGQKYCSLHMNEETPTVIPSKLSPNSLAQLNRENSGRQGEQERDILFVIEGNYAHLHF